VTAATLTEAARTRPEIREILISAVPHTEAAERIGELGHPTTEASIRRWRSSKATGGPTAEIALRPAAPLPDGLSRALDVPAAAGLTIRQVTRKIKDGVTATTVSAVADAATALQVEKHLACQPDCEITVRYTPHGAAVVIREQTDNVAEEWARAVEESITGEDQWERLDWEWFYEGWVVSLTGKTLQRGWNQARKKRFLGKVRDRMAKHKEWHHAEPMVYIHDNAICPATRHTLPPGWHGLDEEVVIYEGPCVIDLTGGIHYVPDLDGGWKRWVEPDPDKCTVRLTVKDGVRGPLMLVRKDD
jgi:hypothetical protein